MRAARLEMISTTFALGWCDVDENSAVFVCATLDGATLGLAEANLIRPDLEKRKQAHNTEARAFLIIFRQTITQDKLQLVEVRTVGHQVTVTPSVQLRLDRNPVLQVFVFGSPRSGTSQLAKTISDEFSLPWLGEGHGAPLFAQAARALSGDPDLQGGFPRFLASQKFSQVAVEAAQRAYYFTHASASFLDKTPGILMINAAPFIVECFPAAKFVYLVRNGISNVLSRLAKFGGRFEAHCADWVAAHQAWENVCPKLPHFLEVRHEDLEADPAGTAHRLAAYLDQPVQADALRMSLQTGSLERTGAGRGKMLLEQTGWSDKQIEVFVGSCGPMMQRLGYPLRSQAATRGVSPGRV